jgi:tetratricopeptide (TPR) repeat protein
MEDLKDAPLEVLRDIRRALGDDAEASERRFLALLRQKLPKVIAVLPFRTDEAGEAEGVPLYLADPLISRLSVIPQVIVRPANATSRYRHVSEDLVTAGRELKADYVLGGSVNRVGGRVRATAQLMSVHSSATLLETECEESWQNILTLEDSICAQVVSRLNLRLTPGEWQRMMKRHTEILEAYQKYNLGRFHWNKFTDESFSTAITCFKQAIEVDHNYARAFAGIADCYTWMGILNLYPPEKTFREAKKWAERALELDRTLAEAHTSLAYTRLCYDWDWTAAEAEFRHAIELGPNYATAHQGYAHLLAVMGRFDEALAEVERALRIDPHSLIINVVKGVILYEARRYDSSLKQFLETVELDNKFDATYYGLALVYGKVGKFSEARKAARIAYKLSRYMPVKKTVMAYNHAMSDEVDKAQQELRELNESRTQKNSYISPFHMALIYAALNKVDQAFECLEEAFKDRDQWLVFLKVEPRLDALRKYQQFQEMLLRLNFG